MIRNVIICVVTVTFLLFPSALACILPPEYTHKPLFFKSFSTPPDDFVIQTKQIEDEELRETKFFSLEMSYLQSINKDFDFPLHAFKHFDNWYPPETGEVYVIGEDLRNFTIHLTLSHIAYKIDLPKHSKRHLLSAYGYLTVLFDDETAESVNLLGNWNVELPLNCAGWKPNEFAPIKGYLDQYLAKEFADFAVIINENSLGRAIREEFLYRNNEN